MFTKRALIVLVLLGVATAGLAQVRRDGFPQAPANMGPAAMSQQNAASQNTQPPGTASLPNTPGNAKWKAATPGNRPQTQPGQPIQQVQALQPGQPAALTAQSPVRQASAASVPRGPIAKVSDGPGNLPRDAGQKWLDYDISPYTTRVTSTNRPEQAILDWILRETGYETWHTSPISLLNADNRTLSVYATPDTHKVVADMVDRFVNTEAEASVFGMRMITLSKPDWRSKAHRYLRPLPTQSPGIQVWLLHKEDASLVIADLQKRSDFREHSPQHMLINNGQSKGISAMHPKNYSRDVVAKPGAWPGFEVQTGTISEGFNFEFSPLLSIDGKEVDAIIKCEVDLIENMVPVYIDVPTANVRSQRIKIEVPQAIASRLHERFRWPADQVLLISLGVVPTPTPQGPKMLPVNVPFISPAPRSDVLIFVDSKGKMTAQPSTLQPGAREATTFPGRY